MANSLNNCNLFKISNSINILYGKKSVRKYYPSFAKQIMSVYKKNFSASKLCFEDLNQLKKYIFSLIFMILTSCIKMYPFTVPS